MLPAGLGIEFYSHIYTSQLSDSTADSSQSADSANQNQAQAVNNIGCLLACFLSFFLARDMNSLAAHTIRRSRLWTTPGGARGLQLSSSKGQCHQHYAAHIDTTIRPLSYSRTTKSKENSSDSHATSDDQIPIKIKAYYVAKGIDIVRVQSRVYGSHREKFQSKLVTITLNAEANQYIAIFNYGSIVFFNVPEKDHFSHFVKMKEQLNTPIAESLQHTEDYRVVVNKQLEKPSIIKATLTNIRSLDEKNLTVIGTVIAQSVALDYYAGEADKMLESFNQINKNIEDGDNFDMLDNKALYKLIASNNAVITNILSKMGIFEGTDAAWDNADYHYTWEGMFVPPFCHSHCFLRTSSNPHLKVCERTSS